MIRVDHVGVPARARLDAAGLLASLFDRDRKLERGLFFQMPDGHLCELMASNPGEA